ncbi:hypothetical protein IAW_05837 [Bacillus cereus str. Schrouff]|uniref:hypothetical protein n=1 Tax=Bacillus cereus TaxID=1396 RepID=UPI000330EEA5|nr:hypothetical protein [Bacillus cereus]EOO05018.1 hypothetical protein IAW_05837 [Bacillus cereus str. Schrouff]EOO81648.1 hypothetical protein IGY_05670 [Bacillus cereus K-5975c]
MSNNNTKINVKHCSISEVSLTSNEGQLNLKLQFNSDTNVAKKIGKFLEGFDDFLIAKGYGDGIA